MSETVVITVKVPRKLAENLEKYLVKGSYTNRSEFIRSAIREKLERLESQQGGEEESSGCGSRNSRNQSN
jgi:metal-responsive CopG/Arc/MetJ family transcriptional regulator